MATYTRQQILERFSKVERDNVSINPCTLNFPCFLDTQCVPEPEDVIVDFDKIAMQLNENDKKK